MRSSALLSLLCLVLSCSLALCFQFSSAGRPLFRMAPKARPAEPAADVMDLGRQNNNELAELLAEMGPAYWLDAAEEPQKRAADKRGSLGPRPLRFGRRR
uniref:FLP-21 n=1 Tax=Radopholus similis TaxID=46012 RepID=C1KH74_RADSI|nr:FLP-21 [Radopholus similis]